MNQALENAVQRMRAAGAFTHEIEAYIGMQLHAADLYKQAAAQREQAMVLFRKFVPEKTPADALKVLVRIGGPLSVSRVQEVLGVGWSTAESLLKALAADGRARTVKAGKAVRYQAGGAK
jgi:hypothetical protein